MSFPFQLVERAEDLGPVAEAIQRAEAVGLDLETTGFSPRACKIRLMALSTGDTVYVLDLFKTGPPEPVLRALASSKAVKVGQNLKFDQKFLLHHYGLELWPIFDTFRASSVIYNGKKEGHDLYSIYARELGMSEHNEDMGASNWAGTLSPTQLAYSAEDVSHLLQLRTVLKAKLREGGLNKVALIEFQAVLPEASMELNGFHLNQQKWLELFVLNRIRASQLQEELLREMPHPRGQISLPGLSGGFNLNSPKQMLEVFARMGIHVESTREMVMAMFAAQNPLVRKFIDFKKTSKLCTAFGPDYLAHIDPITGRIHCSFYPYTGAGRYACSAPNLQQIPRKKEFRLCFEAEDGWVLIVADYSQIELRLAAEISGDRMLMDVYKRGEDAHKMTASIVNEVALDQVTKFMRQLAKPINFGLIYGLGPDKLVQYAQASYGVTMSREDAVRFIDKYFQGYSGIKDWHRRAISYGKRTMQVRTLSGRIRYLDEDAHNEILNTPVQGCYPASVRVLTKGGYLSLGEVSSGTVWTGTRWAFFRRVSKGKWRRACLHFSNGQKHDCDTRHKVLVARDDRYEFVHYRSLSVGDRICLSLAEPREFGEASTVSTEEFYWLGFAVGNGSSERGANWLSLSIGNRKARYEHRRKADEAVAFFARRWNPRRCDEPQGKKMSSVVVENKAFRVRWEELGFPWGCDAHTKTLPVGVWTASLAHRQQFLCGLLDADGTVGDAGKTPPSLHMCNEALLRDVQILARTVGVESTLRGPLKPCEGSVSWRLDLNGGQLATLAYGSRKRTNVQMPAPMFVAKAFLAAVEVVGSKLRGSAATLASRLRAGGTMSVYTLARLCVENGLELGVPIYAYTALCSKEALDSAEEMYTLVVDDPGHRFDAEGVIAKNSGADGLKASLPLLYQRLKKYDGRAKMVHMVHDEIVVEAQNDPELIVAVQKDQEEAMIEGMQQFMPRVPVVCEGSFGRSWADKA